MSIIIKSGDSANTANVTADGELQVRLCADPESAGFVRLAGVLYGGDEGEDIQVGEDGHLLVGQESLLFYDQVEGASINSNQWQTSTSGSMAVAQSAGLITLNSGSTTTASQYAILQSIKHLPFTGRYPIRLDVAASFSTAGAANVNMEFGIGALSGAADPTDGVFIRAAPDGTLYVVINDGGAETTHALTFGEDPFVAGQIAQWSIIIDNDDVHIMFEGDMVCSMQIPANRPFITAAGRLPIVARVETGASAPAAAPQLKIGAVVAAQLVLNQNRPWETQLASMGRGSHQNPATYGQTANHANSTNPASATLSNTAAGYASLGGRYQFVAPASASTDFALFAFQVPTGYQLYVYGVSISAVNTGAAVATTPTIMEWSLGVNASALSLATGDSGTTAWAPRRIPLGLQSFLVGAAVGAQADDVDRDFPVPYVVDSGRYLHIILQVPIGTATVSQIIRGTVTVHGFFE